MVTFGAAWLEFLAMSPVLMIHGAGDNASFFFRTRPLTGGIQGFDTSFKTAGAPIDYLYDPTYLPPEGDKAAMRNGGVLEIAPGLKARLLSYAEEWGVSKLHLIAHSKGGLFARYFAKTSTYSAAPPVSLDSFGFLTVTTLDTPHHGTIIADLLLLPSLPLRFLPRIPKISRLYGMFQGVYSTAIARFNEQVAPPTISLHFTDADLTDYTTLFGTTGAEADLNRNQQIEAAEARGFDDLPTWAVSSLYYILKLPVCLWQIDPPISCWFQPTNSNDCVVTVESSRLQGAEEISRLDKNHQTVGDFDIGEMVLARIKANDPVPSSW
jgi:hypothetical protein